MKTLLLLSFMNLSVWVHTAVCQATSAIRHSQGSASITDTLSNIPISIYTWNFDSTPPSPAW